MYSELVHLKGIYKEKLSMLETIIKEDKNEKENSLIPTVYFQRRDCALGITSIICRGVTISSHITLRMLYICQKISISSILFT